MRFASRFFNLLVDGGVSVFLPLLIKKEGWLRCFLRSRGGYLIEDHFDEVTSPSAPEKRGGRHPSSLMRRGRKTLTPPSTKITKKCAAIKRILVSPFSRIGVR